VSSFTAFYDANVLYSAPLRDLLMHLALTDLFRAKWSNKVHEEWMENLLRKRPDLTRENLEKTRRLMDADVRDYLVEDYAHLISGLELPDPDDRHVVAAAIRGRSAQHLARARRLFGETSPWARIRRWTVARLTPRRRAARATHQASRSRACSVSVRSMQLSESSSSTTASSDPVPLLLPSEAHVIREGRWSTPTRPPSARASAT
jgi:hypothetical protein